ncbi:hypothetical protein EYC84_006777 [Monilinia fructicola]|uniref:Uncharacterized protein n=1 Tax=Monilinia fructicola TaxID=38448 RepID=A0A5M9K9C8_MONFR|nr:hypothetical protein EYC84_006777 [Monilinia fructicola]
MTAWHGMALGGVFKGLKLVGILIQLTLFRGGHFKWKMGKGEGKGKGEGNGNEEGKGARFQRYSLIIKEAGLSYNDWEIVIHHHHHHRHDGYDHHHHHHQDGH